MILCYNNVLKKEEKNLKQFKNNSRGKKKWTNARGSLLFEFSLPRIREER